MIQINYRRVPRNTLPSLVFNVLFNRQKLDCYLDRINYFSFFEMLTRLVLKLFK